MTNTTRNIIRTAVPSLVGAAVAYITKATAHVSPTVLAVVFPVATTAYYTLVRLLEEKFPKMSWLIGCLPVQQIKVVDKIATPTVTK